MQEKIYDEWNKPDWVQVASDYFQKIKDQVEIYKNTIHAINAVLESDETNDDKVLIIEGIIKELENEIS